MKTLLITGFMPFGGEAINPSWEAVSRLPDEVCGYRVKKICVPVTFADAAATVLRAAGDLSPDVILSVGQAGGRSAVTPEMVAINLRNATMCDNAGACPEDEPVLPGGAAAYFSTLPVRTIAAAVRAVGLPSEVSYSAGTYVCNDLFYTLLSHYEGTGTRVGFLHIPYATEQNKTPAMEIADMVRALTAVISAID